MARNKKNQINIDNSDPALYPDARIRDNTGAGDGTPVNEVVYGDIHEFFAKAMRLYNISFNSLPDNTLNGYQLLEAIIALASKNDFLLDISTDGDLIVPLKLNHVKEGESFTCIALADKVAETKIKGSLDAAPILKNVTFKGGDYKTGEYIRLVVTAAGVDLIRLSDGDALEVIAEDFGFLKAASQAEENAGAINTVATTPLTNFTTFALRVIGADSINYLATQIRNGLLSKEDKIKIDAGNNEINYGTFGPVDVDYTSPIGTNVAVSGDITQAQVTANTSNGEVYTLTLANPMDDTNYSLDISVESLGTIDTDNNINPVVWKKINTTQLEIYLQEDAVGGTQSIKIHVAVKQR